MKEIKINEDTRIAINAGVKVTVTNGAVIFEKEMPRWKQWITPRWKQGITLISPQIIQ